MLDRAPDHRKAMAASPSFRHRAFIGGRFMDAASVRTDDLSRARRVADALHAWTASVNRVDALSVRTPLGGMRRSGFGRDLSLHSLDKYTAPKAIWVKYRA